VRRRKTLAPTSSIITPLSLMQRRDQHNQRESQAAAAERRYPKLLIFVKEHLFVNEYHVRWDDVTTKK
jgi:hypothetical protein